MALVQKYQSSVERRKLRLQSTIFTFVLAAALIVALSRVGSVPEYRLFDMVLAPLYVFIAFSGLLNSRAVGDIWLKTSTMTVISALSAFTILALLIPLHLSLLKIFAVGVCGGILDRIIFNSYSPDERGWGLILRTGLGLGFGLSYGFLFGFIAWGLTMFGFQIGSSFARIFTVAWWGQMKRFFILE